MHPADNTETKDETETETEYPLGTTHNTQEIDAEILSEDHLVINEWVGDHGIQLYRFETDIQSTPPVFIGATQHKEIDGKTGDTNETTTIHTIGHINITTTIRETEIREHFTNTEAATPRNLHGRLNCLTTEIEHRLNTADYNDIRLDTTTNSALQIHAGGDDPEAVSKHFADKYSIDGDAVDWEVFINEGLDDMPSVTLLRAYPSLVFPHTDSPSTEVFGSDMYYNPQQIEFTHVSPWVLRYIENRYCGCYPSKQMAAIHAMMNSDEITTQAEMADILDVTESAISQRKNALTDFQNEVAWMCHNRR